MSHFRMHRALRRSAPLALALLLATLGGCGGGGGGGGDEAGNGVPMGGGGGLTPSGELPSDNGSADFALRSTAPLLRLVEGDPAGLSIPLALDRFNGHERPVTLRLGGLTDADVAAVSGGLIGGGDDLTLEPGDEGAEAVLRLAIADRPIQPAQRRFLITASDGLNSTRTELTVDVEPIDAPDVYLLLGQSNMVGASEPGARQAFENGPDAPDPRVLQLNVAPNRSTVFADADDFTSPATNIVPPPLVVAEDPLHVPADAERPDGGKDSEQIGLGLTFGKRALAGTSGSVILVPAAWSGSAFCANEDGPPGQWNARPTEEDPLLGNTWLFDRALTRANAALAESGGILRGILWHQGESDVNEPCSVRYAANLARLAAELRTRIIPDRRGAALRGADAPIPFVVGTMSRGVDERGDYSTYNAPKQRVDDVHRAVPELIPHSAVSLHDDLVPSNGYPCGEGSCVHFGAAALREMGVRYHDALLRALAP